MCESVTGFFMTLELAWTVGDLHYRIRSGVTSAKAIETLCAMNMVGIYLNARHNEVYRG
jgi:hypothetical protein